MEPGKEVGIAPGLGRGYNLKDGSHESQYAGERERLPFDPGFNERGTWLLRG
jgi:hypothetical protein